MSDGKSLPQRRSLRLADYDYTLSGAYFVTVCAASHVCLFGTVVAGEMRLNAYGQIAEREWRRTAEMRTAVTMDAWVVMPNHVHGIVVIEAADDSELVDESRMAGDRRSPLRSGRSTIPVARGPAKASLGALIAGYKAAVARSINELRGTNQPAIWQRSYYEHVIRNDEDLQRIREYIVNNPARWSDDRYYREPSNEA